ncbi:MAG: bifunctional chorismate mutase/prephenate dehydratase [Oscillospiraceae bacterium]|jgi:chorismate mutase/prephenate dehydratase|nr:bifunctional chorismate mutase/prephenate dehydratase [Oscillospiraceae bacterium]
MDLEDARKNIDKIDAQITKLFELRMGEVLNVARIKKAKGIPVLNKAREAAVIEKNSALLSNPEFRPALERLYSGIFSIAHEYEGEFLKEKYNIGYQGVEGAFGHTAMLLIFKNELAGGCAEARNYRDFSDVFDALESGEIKYGVVPVENSSTGVIRANYDLLRERDVYILSEHSVRVEHNLLAPKGARLEDIRRVYSHPQGFEQSGKFLARHKDWERFPYYNTAISAKFVAEQASPSFAAISSRDAARLYNLEIIAENIGDNSKNYTRFVKLGRELAYDNNADKISFIFGLRDAVGSLLRVLEAFRDNNINMNNLESRPIPNQPWEYVFYSDVASNLDDGNFKKAIDRVRRDAAFVKILGCYKREVF